MKQYNALAFEKIFETYGSKFWDRIGDNFRRHYLRAFIRWRTPNLDKKMVIALAEPMTWYSYEEFDPQTKVDLIRFQKKYAHTEDFRKLMNDASYN